jgi:tRNA G18 (ribose-2'-O)-methylase SpoU
VPDTTIAVTDADDPLLADFRALSDPETRRRVERDGDFFVVEGLLAIERLLSLDEWHVRSFALLPRVAERLGPLIAERAPGVAVAVAGEDVLREVAGFDIHRGALASVDRRPRATTAELVDAAATSGGGRLLLALEGLNDHENLGALYRNAAAFGAVGVLLDPTCADPFYRRAVRVSLGHVLAVPTGSLAAAPGGLTELHRLGVTTVALTPHADIALRDLDRSTLTDGPIALLLGAEGPGLTDAALESAHHRVSIPMAPGVDSINVAAASAVALHHLST